MFKPTKLLKVVSILMIIFGVLGVLSVIGSAVLIKNLAASGTAMPTEVMEALSPISIGISVLLALVEVALGILGVAGKALKAAIVGTVAMFLLHVFDIVYVTIISGFAATSILGFLIPVLYAWGLYQSIETRSI
jgi:hypothetical protein